MNTLQSPQLPPTTLGTPEDLCDGIALFPALGSFRAEVKVNTDKKSLFNFNHTILLSKLSADANVSLQYGICGPSYTLSVPTGEGTINGNQLTWPLKTDDMTAGMVFGDLETVRVNLTAQTAEPSHWWKPWDLHWSSAFNVSKTVEFSVLVTLIEVLVDLALEGTLEQEGEGSQESALDEAGLTTTFRLVGNGAGIAKNNSVVAEPKVAVNINIAPDIEGLDAIAEGLKSIGGSLAFGPTLQIGVPVTAKINSININGTDFNNVSVQGGTLTAFSSIPLNSAPSGNVTTTLQHTVGFDFRAGVFFNLTVLKVFSIGGSWTFSVTNLLGINVQAGPYNATTTSELGGKPISINSTTPKVILGEPVLVGY